MIDASKSPLPIWKRYGTYVALVILLAGAAFFIWTKELHHSLNGSSNPPAHSAPSTTTAPAPSHAVTKRTPPTTVPGGIAMSSRDPFSS